MKQFEEWAERRDLDTDSIVYPWVKESWITALWWVLDTIEYHYGEELENSDIVLDIKKELKNEKM